MVRAFGLVVFGFVFLTSGCTRISIAPSCPATLKAGETGEVRANETNPGAIATYRWEVFPEDAGRFTPPINADTAFQALKEGELVLRLTASDGLFQVIDECVVSVEGRIDVAVSIGAAPNPGTLGENVFLACESVGSIEAMFIEIRQTAGESVNLIGVSPGAVVFTPTVAGDYTFECTGISDEGVQALPSVVTVTIPELEEEVSVLLDINPDPALVGERVTLACVSTGRTNAASISITQTEGEPVELFFLGRGLADFTADTEGDFTFECVGISDSGVESEPVETTVSVVTELPNNANDNASGNTNDNGNDDRK